MGKHQLVKADISSSLARSEEELLQMIIQRKPNMANILGVDDKAVILLIDCSASMAGNNKIQQAINGAIEFANTVFLQQFKIQVIAFSSDVEIICDFTTDKNKVTEKVRNITASGSTYMCKAIEFATAKLKDLTGQKVICIFTDGQPNSKEAARKAAQRAKELGIRIQTSGTHDADLEFLRELATDPFSSVVVSDNDCLQAFKTMASQLALPAHNQ